MTTKLPQHVAEYEQAERLAEFVGDATPGGERGVAVDRVARRNGAVLRVVRAVGGRIVGRVDLSLAHAGAVAEVLASVAGGKEQGR